jgi:hypothetical protein
MKEDPTRPLTKEEITKLRKLIAKFASSLEANAYPKLSESINNKKEKPVNRKHSIELFDSFHKIYRYRITLDDFVLMRLVRSFHRTFLSDAREQRKDMQKEFKAKYFQEYGGTL